MTEMLLLTSNESKLVQELQEKLADFDSANLFNKHSVEDKIKSFQNKFYELSNAFPEVSDAAALCVFSEFYELPEYLKETIGYRRSLLHVFIYSNHFIMITDFINFVRTTKALSDELHNLSSYSSNYDSENRSWLV